MPRISIVADQDLINGLLEDPGLPIERRERTSGTVAESERLGFELGSIVTLIGVIAPGIEAFVLVKHLMRAADKTKNPKLEITSPHGRISVNMDGKSEEEIVALVRLALPFVK